MRGKKRGRGNGGRSTRAPGNQSENMLKGYNMQTKMKLKSRIKHIELSQMSRSCLLCSSCSLTNLYHAFDAEVERHPVQRAIGVRGREIMVRLHYNFLQSWSPEMLL